MIDRVGLSSWTQYGRPGPAAGLAACRDGRRLRSKGPEPATIAAPVAPTRPTVVKTEDAADRQVRRRHQGGGDRRSPTSTAATEKSCCPRRWARARRSSTTTATATRISCSSIRAPGPAKKPTPRRPNALYRNDGKGQFEDVTKEAGPRQDVLRPGGRRSATTTTTATSTSTSRRSGGATCSRTTARAGSRTRPRPPTPRVPTAGSPARRFSTSRTTAISISSSATTSPGRPRSTRSRASSLPAWAGPTGRRPRSTARYAPLAERRRAVHRRQRDLGRPGPHARPASARGQIAGRGSLRCGRRRPRRRRGFQRHGAELPVPQQGGRKVRGDRADGGRRLRPVGLAARRDGRGLGLLPQRRAARAGDRQLRQRDDRALRDRPAVEPPVLGPREPLRSGRPDAAAAQIRAVLLRLRPRRPARPALGQRPP